MSDPHIRAKIRIAQVAPLGIKFYDTVTGQLSNRLNVVAAPENRLTKETALRPNRRNVYYANRVYGLHEVIKDADNDKFWEEVAGKEAPYRITVTSPQQEFIPFHFAVNLPHHGYFVPDCMVFPDAPEKRDDVFNLYPADKYRAPSHLVTVRAELHDPITNRPAAYAVVDALHDGMLLGRGIATKSGNLTLCFAYPAPEGGALNNGNGNDNGNRNRRRDTGLRFEWAITLRAFYTRVAADIPLPNLLDICQIFTQGTANLWANWSGDSDADAGKLETIDLKQGEQPILKSSTTVLNLRESCLFITPTA